MSDIVTLARRHKHVAPTHYEGCEVDHIGCLVNRLADEIEGLRVKVRTWMRRCWITVGVAIVWLATAVTLFAMR